ncbi:MAG: IclR family transcriptional regulator [Clostridiales bacterium]|nr:IclR family transcriptional regulator [Clostridiales bacterium]
MSEQQSSTRSIDRALEILECFLNGDGRYTLSELSQSTGLAATTVLRILGALISRGFIEKDELTKTYMLGYKVSQLSKLANHSNESVLKNVSEPYMNELLDKYNEDVRLFVEDGQNKLCIMSLESTRSLRHIMKVGDRHELIKGAAGKIILCYMDLEKRRPLLMESNITDELLETIKTKGYAVSIGEKEEGIVGIAAPILDWKNNLVACLSLSGPSIRFVNEEIEDKIKDTVNTARNISEAYINFIGKV